MAQRHNLAATRFIACGTTFLFLFSQSIKSIDLSINRSISRKSIIKIPHYHTDRHEVLMLGCVVRGWFILTSTLTPHTLTLTSYRSWPCITWPCLYADLDLVLVYRWYRSMSELLYSAWDDCCLVAPRDLVCIPASIQFLSSRSPVFAQITFQHSDW